jgi:hypothetical protein
MNKKILILLPIVLLFCFSCKENKQRTVVEQVISEWKGKEIRFPSEFQCNLLGKDTSSTLCSKLLHAEYKIILYVDSSGCTNCRLRLYDWKNRIDETDSLGKNKLSYLFFYHPKKKNEMPHYLKQYRFDYPVFIDIENRIGQLNHFPSQPELQCFLLDKDNKVLMLGNPVLNPKIWELYKQTIAGEKQASKPEELTPAQPDKTVHDYGVIQKGSARKAVFTIRNTGHYPLLIHQVSASQTDLIISLYQAD